MKNDRDEINAKGKEKEMLQGLEKLSPRLIKGDDDSIEALYNLKDLLDKVELFEDAGRVDPRLLSIVWILESFIHDLWANFGGDSKGIPKTGGKEILQNIARYIGVYIQNSLFKNAPRESIGTFEDVIASYGELLRNAGESYEKEEPQEYIVL